MLLTSDPNTTELLSITEDEQKAASMITRQEKGKGVDLISQSDEPHKQRYELHVDEHDEDD
jgi:hypothetical protein